MVRKITQQTSEHNEMKFIFGAQTHCLQRARWCHPLVQQKEAGALLPTYIPCTCTHGTSSIKKKEETHLEHVRRPRSIDPNVTMKELGSR